MIVTDLTTGTGENPTRAPFSGKRNALVIVLFTDASKELVEGAATSAQAKARTSLQQDGYDVSSARCVTALEAPEGKSAYVEFALHVATEEPDEGSEVSEE